MSPGDVLGRFRLEAAQPDGSWRARDGRGGATVRIRLVEPYGIDFLAAGRRLVGLEDPALFPITDLGVTADGQAWVAEAWQSGETLTDRVQRVGALPHDQLLAVAESLFAGLAVAHARGVRDGAITPDRLKIVGDPPEAILLVQPGLGALLTDLVPDPDFAPPEGSNPTVAADLFGAAATLCFAALGASVPAGQAIDQAAPRLPPALLDALRQCLDPDPHDRPHSVEPLKRAAQALRRRDPVVDETEPGLAATMDGLPGRRPDAGIVRGPRDATAEARLPIALANRSPDVVVDRTAESGTPRRTEPQRPAAAVTPVPPRPSGPEVATFEATLGVGGDDGTFDFSADHTLPPEGSSLATLTLPAAPPIPERRPAGPGSRPPERPAAVASLPDEPADPVLAVEARPEVPRPPRPRPAPPPVAESRPGRSWAVNLFGGALLLLGLGGLVAWRMLRDPPEERTELADAPVTQAPVTAAPLSAAGPTEPPRETVVRVISEAGTARFVQVPTGTVLCDGVDVCLVPIDVPTRIEKAGFAPRVLSGDDLYDRRGGRWRVKLYPNR